MDFNITHSFTIIFHPLQSVIWNAIYKKDLFCCSNYLKYTLGGGKGLRSVFECQIVQLSKTLLIIEIYVVVGYLWLSLWTLFSKKKSTMICTVYRTKINIILKQLNVTTTLTAIFLIVVDRDWAYNIMKYSPIGTPSLPGTWSFSRAFRALTASD